MATALVGALMEFHASYGGSHRAQNHTQELEQGPQFLWERRFMHYSTLQRILLVGEGDFSFSSTLATKIGRACNIVATSLDSKEKVLRAYKSASITIGNLIERGACVLHGVDATNMDQWPELRGKCFDRIIFNFPHAGFHGKEDDPKVLKKHRDLMRMFFRSASMLLAREGQIHVTHKMGEPYDSWNLAEEAYKCGLFLCCCVDFDIRDYQGYNNKRGDGVRIDESFALGECTTYMFKLTYDAFIEKELLLARRESLFSPLKRRYENVREEEDYRPLKRQRMESTYINRLHEVPGIRFNLPLDVEEDCYRPLKRKRMEVPGMHVNLPLIVQRAEFPSDPLLPLPHATDRAMPRLIPHPREINERSLFGLPRLNLNLPSWPWL